MGLGPAETRGGWPRRVAARLLVVFRRVVGEPRTSVRGDPEKPEKDACWLFLLRRLKSAARRVRESGTLPRIQRAASVNSRSGENTGVCVFFWTLAECKRAALILASEWKLSAQQRTAQVEHRQRMTEYEYEHEYDCFAAGARVPPTPLSTPKVPTSAGLLVALSYAAEAEQQIKQREHCLQRGSHVGPGGGRKDVVHRFQLLPVG